MPRRKTARAPKAGLGLRTWLILIGAAKNRQTLLAADVAARAGIGSTRAMVRTLERISALCASHGLPALEVLVVGEAVILSEAKDLLGRIGTGPRTDLEAAREAVFAFDWYAVRPPSDQDLDAAARAAQPRPTRKRRIATRTYDRKKVPKSERTRNVGDDAEALAELARDTTLVRRGPARAGAPATAAPTWRVAKCLLALRDQVNQMAPGRNKASDGTIGDAAHAARTSDHNPWVRDGEVGVVTAMDITHHPAGGCDAEALAEAIRASREPRVKYIIWNRRIASSSPINGARAWDWRPYTGANPHDKHVHISVKPEKAAFDSTSTWAI